MNAESAPTSVDAEEIARFERQAAEWWDENGPFRPLHRLNPARMSFIRDRLCGHFERDPLTDRPLSGLRLVDVGCGGGLVSEPLARLGATVTAIDAGAEAVGVARAHAALGGVEIDYRRAAAEDIAAAGERFDAVVSLEVIEHVAGVGAFLGALAQLTKPGGALVLGTINRTLKSLALAKLGAEYILRWVPAGTHDWRQFARPSELARGLRPHGVEIGEIKGAVFNPLTGEWRLGRDAAVNYLAYFRKSPN